MFQPCVCTSVIQLATNVLSFVSHVPEMAIVARNM
jgi:hypothetical protein